MNMSATSPIPMHELNCSNHLIGNKRALDAAWEHDGYWFFRGVLDLAAVERLRGIYLEALENFGVITPGDATARYNGASLEAFPLRMDPLSHRRVYRTLADDPSINAFFRTLLQDEPFWVPTVEYRAVPPATQADRPLMAHIHEDGVYNRGIKFRICWVPLSPIDEEVGGLALAEGLHRGPCLHEIDGEQVNGIPLSAVAPGAWRRSFYQPGDLLMMDIHTPHTGLANRSDRFRLSIDLRVVAMADNPPLVGTLTAVSPNSISLRNGDGLHEVRLVPDTYCRGLDGRKIPLDLVPKRFFPGDEVIVGVEHGVATVLRPPH
jgi:hypothetical protein